MKDPFHAYDIRFMAKDMDMLSIERIANSIAKYFQSHNVDTVVLGRDPRISSPAIYSMVASNLLEHGIRVRRVSNNDHDVCSTGLFYYACSQTPGDTGVMITGSHLHGDTNGIKIVGPGVTPIPYHKGLNEIEAIYESPESTKRGTFRSSRTICLTQTYPLESYLAETFKMAGIRKDYLKGFKVAIDGTNATPGIDLKEMLEWAGADIVSINMDIDGRFPAHEPNPMIAANLEGLKQAVLSHGAKIGLTGDCDYDRIGVVDEKGNIVRPDIIGCLIAESMLRDYSGEKTPAIAYDIRATRRIEDIAKKYGGVGQFTVVGHSYIKEHMLGMMEKGLDVLFAVEFSNHMYFVHKKTDGTYVPFENISLASLKLCKMLQDTGDDLSGLVEGYMQYHHTGERNFEFAGSEGKSAMNAAIGQLQGHMSAMMGGQGTISRPDGLLAEYKGAESHYFISARTSNTEPKLRLNIESSDKAKAQDLYAIASDIIFQNGGKIV